MDRHGKTKGKLGWEEEGSATIISLVTVIAAFLLATTYLYLAQAELRMTTRNIQGRQSLYLAEAGIELARAELAQNPLWQPLPGYTLGSNKFTVSLTRTPPGITVRATGKAGEASRTLEVLLIPNGNGDWKITSYKEAMN